MGISYGYYAINDVTAVLEVADSPPSSFSIGKFSLKQPMLAVDLTSLPPSPSIFDIDTASERNSLMFLHSFVKAISLPVSKDGRKHNYYIPSQIFCLYPRLK